MRNPKLINFLNDNRDQLLKCGKQFFRDQEIAEDCLQNVYLKFLRTDLEDTTNVRSYVLTSLYREFYNYKRNNKKHTNHFHFNGETKLDENGEEFSASDMFFEMEMPQYEEAIDNKRVLSKIYESIESLPKTQKTALYNRLNECHVKTNTEKANYRHALLKLKEIYNPEMTE